MAKEFDFATPELQVLPPGLSVIEANAGTGKTYAISHLVPRLLLEGSVDSVDQIVLVTYTNAAAGELSERVRKVLEKLHAPRTPQEEESDPGIHKLRQRFSAEKISKTIGKALLDIDRLGVSTIHSFCQKVLQIEGALCRMPTIPEVITNSSELINDAFLDFWEERIAAHPMAAAIAIHNKWDSTTGIKFLQEALVLDAPSLVPSPESYEKILSEIEDLRASFPSQNVTKLCDALALAEIWNATAPAPSERERFFKLIKQLEKCSAHEFIGVITRLPEVGKWFHKTNKENKQARERFNEVFPELEAAASEVMRLFGWLHWGFLSDCLGEIRTTVARRLDDARLITFDGLVCALQRGLCGDNAQELVRRLRQRYRVALIDESQDTDPRQFDIFSSIFLSSPAKGEQNTHRLVMIGDPKQAIYSFRGADVNTYLECKNRAVETYQLNKTYRAPAPLVRATNALFKRADSFLKVGLAFTESISGMSDDRRLSIPGDTSVSRLDCWVVPDGSQDYKSKDRATTTIARTVASEIARILNAEAMIISNKEGVEPKKVEPKDIAVLVQGRWQAESVQEALSQLSIPSVRAAGDDVLNSDEAKELLAILNALESPRRDGLRRAALVTRLLGFDDKRLREEAGEDAILEKFQAWQELLQHKGIAPVLAAIDQEMKIVVRLAQMENGERRITNFRHLIDLLQNEFVNRSSHFKQVLVWFSHEVSNAEGRVDEDERQLQLESDVDAVQLVTMHSAKGLEFPLVFCPYLWGGRKVAGIQRVSLQNDPKTYLVETDLLSGTEKVTWISAIQRSVLEENLRLAYVAITRAQVKVWIYAGSLISDQCTSLDWLLQGERVNADWKSIGTEKRGELHRIGIEKIAADDGATNVISWGPPPLIEGVPWHAGNPLSTESPEALVSKPLPTTWELTSFTSLTREKNHYGTGEIEDPAQEGEPATFPSTISFVHAPGGTMMGTAIHGIIEKWDFSEVSAAEVESRLKEYQFEPSPEMDEGALAGSIKEMLSELKQATLPGLGCTVGEACGVAESSEWHFYLPIKDDIGGTQLAKVFANNGYAEYSKALEALPAEDMHGYLHGFLDRIAKHGSSWGVIDWKTNRLGKGMGEYGQGALLKTAMDSHYLLQACLYLVALRRRLGPTPRIAGCWIIFLRGVHKDSAQGILHVKPQDALLAELDELFLKPSIH